VIAAHRDVGAGAKQAIDSTGGGGIPQHVAQSETLCVEMVQGRRGGGKTAGNHQTLRFIEGRTDFTVADIGPAGTASAFPRDVIGGEDTQRIEGLQRPSAAYRSFDIA